MPYPELRARLAVVVAEQTHDTARWGRCPDAPADAATEFEWQHRAERTGPRRKPGTLKAPRTVRRGWKGACSSCGEPIPWDGPLGVLGSSGNNRLYDREGGRLEPGDLFWADHGALRECFDWDNCDGRHLCAVLPNGLHWDIDSRANNCGLPGDRLHRCWVRTGEPPAVTAGKGGRTCSAGAGSILAGDYHGFLVAGVFSAG